MTEDNIQSFEIENLQPNIQPTVLPVVEMREKAGTELNFVKITTGKDKSVIELTGATAGDYTLVLESYDKAEPGEPVIQTDLITLTIQPACSITAKQVTDLQALLDKKAVLLETLANNAKITTESYLEQLKLIESELKLDEAMKLSCGGGLKVKFVNTHKFLRYDDASSVIFLESTEDSKVGSFTDSYLEVKIDTHQLKIPVEAKFKSCEITKLKFSKKSIKVDYKIGSGASSERIPDLVQEPKCNRKFDTFNIHSIKSSLSKEQVLGAVLLDQSELKIETSDFTFSGLSAEVLIKAEQDFLDDDVTIPVSISFTTEPPSFDLEGQSITPLTCSEADADWAIQLPPIAGADEGTVKISLNEEQEHASLFTLTESKILEFVGTALQDFIKGDLCQGKDSFELQFTLSSEL